MEPVTMLMGGVSVMPPTGGGLQSVVNIARDLIIFTKKNCNIMMTEFPSGTEHQLIIGPRINGLKQAVLLNPVKKGWKCTRREGHYHRKNLFITL